jgi:predicted RNA-binding protein with PUA-like domain
MAKRVTKKVQQVQEAPITFQEFLSYDQFQQVIFPLFSDLELNLLCCVNEFFEQTVKRYRNATVREYEKKDTDTLRVPPMEVVKRVEKISSRILEAPTSGRWLVKADPGDWEKVVAGGVNGARWDGIRSRQAANFMRKMQVGDEVLVYRTGTNEKRIVGLAKVTTAAYRDPVANDSDPWVCVDLQCVEEDTWNREPFLTLKQIRTIPALQQWLLVRQTRLSVMPISGEEWDVLLATRNS